MPSKHCWRFCSRRTIPDRLFPNGCPIIKQENLNINFVCLKTVILFPPGFEPGTFRVWGERDNHYTTETHSRSIWQPRRIPSSTVQSSSQHFMEPGSEWSGVNVSGYIIHIWNILSQTSIRLSATAGNNASMLGFNCKVVTTAAKASQDMLMATNHPLHAKRSRMRRLTQKSMLERFTKKTQER